MSNKTKNWREKLRIEFLKKRKEDMRLGKGGFHDTGNYYDWGNVWKWIEEQIKKAKQEEQEETVKKVIKWFSGLDLKVMQQIDEQVSNLIKRIQ